MNLIKASENDSEEIKSFFNQNILKGVIDHRIQRTDSFFLQYRLITNDYSTYLLKNSNNEIEAMASILFRKGYVNHQEQSVGYVTDLCIKPETTTNWAKKFVPVLHRELKERDCQHVFSELEQYDNVITDSLLRRRDRNNNLTRYHLFRKFFLVVLFGRKFWRDEPLRSIKIDFGRTEDIESICNYLKEKSVRKPLSFNLTPEELERRFRVWPNFSIQNFLVARNYSGNIIGCMAPWNNKHVQQYVVHKYHGKSFQIYSSVKSLSTLGLLRPLPKEGSAFNMKFVTHYAYDNPDIFYSLLDHAFTNCSSNELLAYPNYIGDYETRPPRSFFSVKVPHGFYTLLDSSQKLPHYLQPNPFIPPPDFNYAHF